jgi:hypothetical protein
MARLYAMCAEQVGSVLLFDKVKYSLASNGRKDKFI